MLQLKFGAPREECFFVGIGGYAAYNLSGTVTPASAGTFSIGSDPTDNLKALDIGLVANIGYQLENGIFFRARSQYGFTNLQPQVADPTVVLSYTPSIYTRAYSLEIGYFFGHKAKHIRHISKDDGYQDIRIRE